LEKNLNNSILKVLFSIGFLFFIMGNVTAAQWNVGTGQTYNDIQSAIDNVNTIDGDVINVYNGTYTEDVLVNKNLTLQTNNGADVEVKPVNTGFTVVNDGSGDGSGTTINGFRITLPFSGTGINITANDCSIQNNQINGGLTGIIVSGNNTTVMDNVISGQSENGIIGNLTGGFFTVNHNYISDITGSGPSSGITVSINGTVTDFNFIGNTISNINAVGVSGTAFAVQLGKSKGADGNPEVANITNLVVTNNIITGISASSAIMGMELVTSSINALILENVISQLQAGPGSSVYALEAAIIGNGTVLISNNSISGIISDEQAVGIVAVALGELIMENNRVTDISNAKAAVGMLGLGLFKNATLTNNIVSDITSPSIAAGIVGTALAHLNMFFNTVMGINGANTVAMVTAGFNTTTVMGNNLEGDGSGNGIVICSPNGTINYNRIVNFEYYIQNFKFSSFGPSIDEMLKPIDDAIKNHPELEPILKPIRDDLDKLFHSLENSNTTATYNWYGTNTPDEAKFFVGNGTINYYPWLVLTINANPSTITTGQTSTITADVYQDAAGGDHSADAAMFFSGPQVTFTTNLGNVGSKSVTVQWINGLATAILRADEGFGIATVTAADYQIVKTMVTILGASETSKAAVSAQSIEMQNTGIQLLGMVLAILMVLGGFISIPKNQ
jgi:hypothetical protein